MNHFGKMKIFIKIVT